MQHVPPALPKAPVLRVTPGQHVISGFPSKLTQLLLLTDLRAESRPAVEFAIELTRLFTARLTLMHGEPLQSGSTFGREDLPTSPDSDPARLALLCLMWEVRQRGLDVVLSTEAGHAPEQIWRTAAARNVDLIVGSLITMLLWIYYAAQIVLFGAEFTRVYAQERGRGIRPAKHAVRVDRKEIELPPLADRGDK